MHSFCRPQALHLVAAREPASGTCPECGSDELADYRVLSEGGWWDVRKCQTCLHSLTRDPERVLTDARDGYVTMAGAARDYGVVVIGDPDEDPEGLAVDEAATARARARGETT